MLQAQAEQSEQDAEAEVEALQARVNELRVQIEEMRALSQADAKRVVSEVAAVSAQAKSFLQWVNSAMEKRQEVLSMVCDEAVVKN